MRNPFVVTSKLSTKYHWLCHNNLSFSKVQLLRNFIIAYWPTQACKHQHNTLHWTDHIQFSLVSESGRFGCHTFYKTYFIKRVFSVSKELEESFAAKWPQMTKEQQVRKIIGEQYEGGSSTKTGTHTCAVYAMQQLFQILVCSEIMRSMKDLRFTAQKTAKY